MTIEKAKRILGENFSNLSDSEIERIISFYQKISGQIIENYFSENRSSLGDGSKLLKKLEVK